MRNPLILLSLATLATALPAQLAFQLPDLVQSGVDAVQHELTTGADYLSKLKGVSDDSWGLVKNVIHEGGKRCTYPSTDSQV
jgi:hypothetical protein